MNRTDDISNLFNRFGASSDGYHEFDSQFDYKEPVAKATQAPIKAEPIQSDEVPVITALVESKEELVLVPAELSVALTPEVEPPAPVAEVELPVAVPVAEVEASVAVPVAEVAAPVAVSVAEVAAPVAVPVAEVAAPVAVSVAEVEAPVAVPVAEVAAPVAVPVAEVAAPVAVPVAEFAAPVAVPVAEVAAPVVVPVAEFAAPVAVPVAEFAAPVAVPVAEFAAPVAVPVAEFAAPVAVPVAEFAAPVAVPVAEVAAPVAVPVAEVEAPVAVPVAEIAPVTSAFRSPLRSLLAEVVMAREAAAEEALANARPSKCKAHIVAVVSPKGGVGKTTLSAALASSLRLDGGQTFGLDLDPQNALHYHLGVESGVAGIGNVVLPEATWRDGLQSGFGGAQVLPFGALTEDERRALEHDMSLEAHWLAWRLDAMNLSEHDVVIIDTPPGHSVYLQQALDVADEVIVVTTADAASFITLDQMERSLSAEGARPAFSVCHYVVNQFDVSREFSRDMLEVLKRRLGKKLMAVIALDNTLGESLAYGRDPLSMPELSAAYQDVLLLGEQLKSRFVNARVSGLHA